MQKFRFGVANSRTVSAHEWQEQAQRIESMGYATLLITDHMDDSLAPLPALMSAACATRTLRLGTLVLANDFRNPTLLAKEAATLDMLSEGRFELGLGAGWMSKDYAQLGIDFAPPGRRIARLEAAIPRIKRFFETAGGPKSEVFPDAGGSPRPVQRPRPPLLLGGGGRRILRLAGREADIVSLNFTMADTSFETGIGTRGGALHTHERVRWVRDAAGPRFDALELSIAIYTAMVTDQPERVARALSPRYGVSPEEVLRSPHVLVGSRDEICETLQKRRDEYGLSYVVFTRANYEAMSFAVERLAGR